MNKKKAWIAIIGAGVVASLAAAISQFPNMTVLLSSISGLVTIIIGLVNGADNG